MAFPNVPLRHPLCVNDLRVMECDYAAMMLNTETFFMTNKSPSHMSHLTSVAAIRQQISSTLQLLTSDYEGEVCGFTCAFYVHVGTRVDLAL